MKKTEYYKGYQKGYSDGRRMGYNEGYETAIEHALEEIEEVIDGLKENSVNDTQKNAFRHAQISIEENLKTLLEDE